MMITEERMSRLEGAYDQVDRRLGDLRTEMIGLRAEVNDRMSGMESRLHSILIAVIAGSVSIVVTLIAGIITFLIRTT